MGTIDITEMARRTGLAPSALRFYERRGLIQPVGRAGGKRLYEEHDVERIAFIDLLKISGFTLTEIAQFLQDDGRVTDDWRERLERKAVELRQKLDDVQRSLAMVQHTLQCPHKTLDACPVHRAVVTSHAALMSDDPALKTT